MRNRRRNPPQGYTKDLHDLKAYLTKGIDVFDFAWMLQLWFDDQGKEPPDDYDPNAEYDWLDRHPEAHAKFRKFLDTMDPAVLLAEEPHMAPAYLSLTFQRMLPASTWLVHFTDDIGRILRFGFFGMEDIDKIALTTWWGRDKFVPDGWNFAFPVDSMFARRASKTKKYGRHFAVFQSAAVLVYHTGDEEEQAVFRGRGVKEFCPARWVTEHDHWEVGEGADVFTTADYDAAIRTILQRRKS